MANKKNISVGDAFRSAVNLTSTIPLNEASRGLAIKQDKISMLPRNQIHEAREESDIYPELRGVEALAADIRERGIQTPLTVIPNDEGEFVLLSGHRRLKAYDIACETLGYDNGGVVPCIVSKKPSAGREFEVAEALILNNLQRDKTDYERMMEIVTFKSCVEARRVCGEKIPIVRDRVRDRLGVSDTTITRFDKIYTSLDKRLMPSFREGMIASSVAYEVAKLDKAAQDKIVAAWDMKSQLQLNTVNAILAGAAKSNEDTPETVKRVKYVPSSIHEGVSEFRSSIEKIGETIERIEGNYTVDDEKLEKQIIKKLADSIDKVRRLQEDLFAIQGKLGVEFEDDEA